ncbi:unnamed protein product, partial [Sphacelaria rigidula]
VGAVFSLLRAAVEDELFTRKVQAAAAEQQEVENKILGIDDTARWALTGASAASDISRAKRGRKRGGTRALPPTAVRIRNMHHRHRNADEKRWVALDAVVNPSLYHHVTVAEAEEMKWDVLYYTRLDREDILRVLSLPVQAHLALALLHTPDEVAAHELLGRYTLGVDPDHFLQLDRSSQDFCAIAIEDGDSESRMSSTTHAAAGVATEGETPAGSGNNSSHPKQTTSAGSGGESSRAAPRTLAYMRRRAQAQLKTAVERNPDETVWLLLDTKLRPEFYDDSDEVAGDLDEEIHREADAKEDSRNEWRLEQSRGQTKPSVKSFGDLVHPAGVGVRSEDSPTEFEEETEVEAAQRRDVMATQVAEAFGDGGDELSRIAAIVLGYEGIETHGSTQSLGREGDDGYTNKLYGEDGTLTMDKPITQALSPLAKESDRSPATSVAERTDAEPSDEEAVASGPASASCHLREVAVRALTRFLVREEDTPIGRDMTRSLAMLQEATLRLGRGENRVLRNLNQHVAMKALFQAADSCRGHIATNPRTTRPGTDVPIVGSIETQSLSPSVDCVDCGSARGVGGGNRLATGDQHDALPEEEKTYAVGEAIGEEQDVRDQAKKSDWVPTMTFGSWEVIHPASLGAGSQEKVLWSTGMNMDRVEERVHPASFCLDARKGNTSDTLSLYSEVSAPRSEGDMRTVGAGGHHPARSIFEPLKILTGEGCSPVAEWLSTVSESNMVASGMDRVGEFDPGEVRRRGLLVASRARTCLLDVETCDLQEGQSRAHKFNIGPYDGVNRESNSPGPEAGEARHRSAAQVGGMGCPEMREVVVIGLVVTVVFQGNFEEAGYRLGRLAAGLYRMPPCASQEVKTDGEAILGGEANTGHSVGLPQPIGFSPHYLQSLNTADTMGRIMIFHQPRVQPVREGLFQLVIGAASRVRYSATVTALVANDAHAVLDE